MTFTLSGSKTTVAVFHSNSTRCTSYRKNKWKFVFMSWKVNNYVLKSLWSEQDGSFLQKVKQESLVFMLFMKVLCTKFLCILT